MCQLLTHTRTRAHSLPHSHSYSNAHTPHTLQYTLAGMHTHVLPQRHILSHIRMGAHTSHKLTVTRPFIQPQQHIYPHTVSLILTFIHPHTPIFTGALMLTTPIQAPKYLHSPLLHLTHIHTPHLFIHLLIHTCTSHIPSRICTHSHTHARSPPHPRTCFTRACARIDSQGPPDQHSACACAPATGRTLCPAWMPMCLEFGDCC